MANKGVTGYGEWKTAEEIGGKGDRGSKKAKEEQAERLGVKGTAARAGLGSGDHTP